MNVTIKDKENIARRTVERKNQLKMSLTQIGEKVGVNKSTVNKLVHPDGKWRNESVSEEMWSKFANWVGFEFGDDAWQINREATNFRRYYNMCQHAQEASIMRIISDTFGKGKSTALQTFAFDHTNSAWYFKCHKSWTQRVLLRQIKKALNLPGPVQNTYDALSEITTYLRKNKHLPQLLIFDEYNRLPEGSKAQIFSIYEETEYEVGMILCGGENLEKELKRGVDNAKQDCQEIFDRGGSKYLKSKPLTIDQAAEDIITICDLNGVKDPLITQAIINNFSGSFRKVKADIDDYKRKLRKGGQK